MYQYILENVKAIFTLLAGLGILGGGFGYLVSQFKEGSSKGIKSAEDLMNFWKSQAEGYKLAMDEKDKVNSTKFEELNAKIGNIQGQLTEKERQNKEYLEILQNRDPETQRFQSTMVESMKYMAEVLKDVHIMTKAEHDRDFVVTAQITKT